MKNSKLEKLLKDSGRNRGMVKRWLGERDYYQMDEWSDSQVLTAAYSELGWRFPDIEPDKQKASAFYASVVDQIRYAEREM